MTTQTKHDTTQDTTTKTVQSTHHTNKNTIQQHTMQTAPKHEIHQQITIQKHITKIT